MRGFQILAVSSCFVFGLGVGSFVQGEQQPAAKQAADEKIAALLKERVETAENYVMAMQALYETGSVTLDKVIDAVLALQTAELAVSDTEAKRSAAREKAVNQLREIERRVAQLYRFGTAGGEEAAYAQIKFYRQTAEIDLLKAQAND